MKKLGLCSVGHFLCILTALSFQTSCINPEYDFENCKVGDTSIFEDVSLPIGDVERMTIEKVLFKDGRMPSSVKTGTNGDMYVDLFHDSYESSFQIPETFGLDEVIFEGIYVNLNTGSYAGLSTSSLPEQTLSFSKLNGGKQVEAVQDLKVSAVLPSEIYDVRNLGLSASMKCCFRAEGVPMMMTKGFEIIFPDFIKLKKNCNSADYSIIDNHILRFNSDTRLADSKTLELSLIMNHINIPAGSIYMEDNERVLKINDNVTMHGDFYINTKDIAVIPRLGRLIFNVNVVDAPVESAEVILDVDLGMKDKELKQMELPDMFKGDNICVDLYNPQMYVKVMNSTPLPFNMSADIVADGSKTLSLSGAESFNVPAGATSNYLISRREVNVSSGTVNVVRPVIGEMLMSMPSKLAVRNCRIDIPKDFVTIRVGEQYQAGIEYAVTSPLAFGEELALSFTQYIRNLSLDMKADIRSVVFDMDIVNSIPFDLNISVVCIDEKGNEIPDTDIALDKEIKAGSHISPVSTPVVLEIRNTTGKLKVDALRLSMQANAPEAAYVGIPLNENQGFEIKDIVLTLSDGIGVRF